MTKKTILMVAMVIALTGANAFAQRGARGYAQGGYGSMQGAQGYAQGGYGMMQGGRGGYGAYGAYGYNATPPTAEQIAKLDTVHQKYFAQFENLRAQIFSQNAIIRAEFAQTTPNQAKINSAIEAKSKSQTEFQKLRLAQDLEIRAILGR